VRFAALSCFGVMNLGIPVLIFSLFGAGLSAQAGELSTLETLRDRMEIIEAQVGLACDGKGLETHDLKTDLADRLISREGPISRIQKDLGAAVRMVGADIEYARERVADRFRKAHSDRMEAQLARVEVARQRLRVEGERARDAIRSEYSRYLELKNQDPVAMAYSRPESRQDFKDQVGAILRVRKKEMQDLLLIGSRAESARMRAAMCYCRGYDSPWDDRCPDSPESMGKKADYIKAVSGYEQVRKNVNPEAK
jgi:hypothetical protein